MVGTHERPEPDSRRAWTPLHPRRSPNCNLERSREGISGNARGIGLGGVTNLRLNEFDALETKIRIEREEPTCKFLLYALSEESDYGNDWLLDIRLSSPGFRAGNSRFGKMPILHLTEFARHASSTKAIFCNCRNDFMNSLSRNDLPTIRETSSSIVDVGLTPSREFLKRGANSRASL